MSLSNPKKSNPCSKFIEWKGSKGQFYYYNKETQENVFFKKDIYIVVLDELSTVRGWHDASESGIYSNEVKYISKEELTVKSFKGGLFAKGIYSEIKGNLQGGKYAKSVYVALLTPKDKSFTIELANIQLYGSAIGAWINAKIKSDDGRVIVLSPSTVEKKKGRTVYFEPEIKKSAVRKDIIAECIELDKELQKYLKHYFSKEIETSEISKDEDIIKDDLNLAEVDDLPF